MAIAKNAGGGGNFIKEAGEYKVKVLEIKTGLSKKGKPMLTVAFETTEEKKIAGYYVKDLTMHMQALAALKVACGLKVTDSADNLVGKECGILVEMQEPDADGRTFASICGYGKASQVEHLAPTTMKSDADDQVPF